MGIEPDTVTAYLGDGLVQFALERDAQSGAVASEVVLTQVTPAALVAALLGLPPEDRVRLAETLLRGNRRLSKKDG